ncbi:MAG: flagellar hook-associated protein FlgL [Syntrophomonadaceae bacterium]|nr:flagellar hook-associated protein FlgL [Syntrophomonadaceae bacterium]
MRITNNMMISNLMRNYYRNTQTLDRQMQQLATGRQFEVPSDDPVRMLQAMRLQTNIFEYEQYSKNVADARSWLESTESALQGAGKILQRVRELTVYANNSTLAEDSRAAIALEVEKLLEEMKNIGNTSFDGRYIFNGQKTTEAPYEWSAVGDGYIDFVGDTGAGIIQYEISAGINIDINVPPQRVFDNGNVNILNEMRNLSDDLKNLTPVNFAGVVALGKEDLSGGISFTNNDLNFTVTYGTRDVDITLAANHSYAAQEVVDNINQQLAEARIHDKVVAELSGDKYLVLKTTSQMDPNSFKLTDNSGGTDNLESILGIKDEGQGLYRVNNFQNILKVGSQTLNTVTIEAGKTLQFEVQVGHKNISVSVAEGTYTGKELVEKINEALNNPSNPEEQRTTDFRVTLTSNNRLALVINEGIDPGTIYLKQGTNSDYGMKEVLGIDEGTHQGYLCKMTNLSYIVGRGAKDIGNVVLTGDQPLTFEIRDNTRVATITLPPKMNPDFPVVYTGVEIVEEINRQLAEAGFSEIEASISSTNRLVFKMEHDLSPERYTITDLSTGTDTLEKVLGIYPGKMMSYLKKVDEGIDNLLRWQAELGSRVARMELVETRLQETSLYITQLVTEQAYIDFAKITMEMKMQENLHRAALAVGARIIMPSLIDFLR